MKLTVRKVCWTIVAVLACCFILTGGAVGLWLYIGLVAVGALSLLASAIRMAGRRLRNGGESKELTLKIVAQMMGFFLLTGSLLYIRTFHIIACEKLVEINNTEYVIRSLICSLDMFMLDVDSNILDLIENHAMLKGAIVIQAICSFGCTVALLLSLVISRLKAYFRLHFRASVTPSRNHLYIFFGMNEPSRLLARSIHERDPKALTVFVDRAKVSDDDADSWNNIVSFFTHRRRTFAMADETDAYVAVASMRFAEIDESTLAGGRSDLLDLVGLRCVRRLIESLASSGEGASLRMFFLSDNEDENIRGLINLTKDATVLAAAADPSVKTKIYCHARYNGPNRVIEDVAIGRRLEVVIVDSSHIAVDELKYDPTCHPVNYVRLSRTNPATVSSAFDALIVGFGEVGRDAFKFLYEFGAFVGEESTPERCVRSSFRCTAVDASMGRIRGAFRAQVPSVGEEMLSLVEADCHGSEFFGGILDRERARSLNYIVLALGDEDENITLASQMFNYIRSCRDDLSDLVIMVRCRDDEHIPLLQRIADHYNYGYGQGLDNRPVIRLFGNAGSVYTFDNIVNDEMTIRGRRFYESYRRIRHEGDVWEMRRRKLTGIDESERTGRPVVPNIDKLRRLRRSESQDLSNALHMMTKIHLAEHALGPGFDWESFGRRLFSIAGESTMEGCGAKIRYPGLDETENILVRNLAMTEHVRWNASHELLGYMPAPEGQHSCDERTRTHNCLLPWEKLDEESAKASSPDWTADYKSYDYCVVETSVAIHTADLNNHSNYRNK